MNGRTISKIVLFARNYSYLVTVTVRKLIRFAGNIIERHFIINLNNARERGENKDKATIPLTEWIRFSRISDIHHFELLITFGIL
jgi:hypothetical protein